MKTLESANVQPVFVAAEVKRFNIIDNQFADKGTDYKVFVLNDENPQGGRGGIRLFLFRCDE